MNVSYRTRYLAAFLAALHWVVTVSPIRALDPPVRSASTDQVRDAMPINDIAFSGSGELRGVVLDAQGRSTGAYRVTVTQDARRVGIVSPDAQGRFRCEGLHGGLFQVTAGRHTYVCRGWAAGTAPPIARDQLLIVSDGVVERGQQSMRDFVRADPVMVGLVVAAAIAIPIAVANSRNDSPPGS